MGTKRSLDTRQETQITPFDHLFRPESGRTTSRSFPELSVSVPKADETSKAQPNVALISLTSCYTEWQKSTNVFKHSVFRDGCDLLQFLVASPKTRQSHFEKPQEFPIPGLLSLQACAKGVKTQPRDLIFVQRKCGVIRG